MTNKNKYLKTIGSTLIVGAFLFLAFGSDDTKSSSSGSSSSTSSSVTSYTTSKTCRWCSNKYTGAGYYHIFDDCRQSEEYGSNCSMSCCMNSWNSKPHQKRVDPTNF